MQALQPDQRRWRLSLRKPESRIISHFHKHIGPTKRTWTLGADQEPLSVPLAEFDGPFPGALTIATMGLSGHVLEQPGMAPIRQELMWMSWKRFRSTAVLSVLEDMADTAIERRVGYKRGEWRDFGAPVVPESQMTALYLAVPVYLPDSFHILDGVYAEPLAAMWVLPVFASESRYCKEHGWDAFEDRLSEADPDLLDLERPPIL